MNDRLGHDVGDALLKEFAKRLESIAGSQDNIARLGGDEFALIRPGVSGEEEITRIAKNVLSRMQHPESMDNATLDCRTSIGVALASEPDVGAEALQKRADLALYQATATTRGAFRLFHPSMQDEAERGAAALELAGRAIESDWIVPFYQPKTMLVSGSISGFEALLRWAHPRLGLQTPESIWPAFDDTELGCAIGRRMRNLVFADIRRWIDYNLPVARIAINASGAEFRHDDYAERVLEELVRFGIPTNRLEVEVSESVFMGRHAENVERAVRRLSTAGVTVALDDFGTGYASLTHLKKFPVDVIKIDRSFIGGIEADAGDAAIVRALLSLGQNLNIEVVAEGVESKAQVTFLKRYGCDFAQGYLFGEAVPAQNVLGLLRSGLRVTA